MDHLTDETSKQRTARFCPQCGEEAGPGVFCPSCGYNMMTPAGVTGAGAQQPAKRRQSRTALIAAGALAVVIVAVVAVIALGSSGGSSGSSSPASADAAYHAKLTSALTPLISANQALSSTLSGLDGSQHAITVAQNATSDAQSALTSARGALTVLTPPSADQALSQQVQQALTDESGYLAAVGSTLATPVGNSAATLQPLATSTQSALVPLAGVAPGASGSLSGTSNLVSWSNGAASAAGRAHDAAQQQALKQAVAQATAAAQSSSGNSSGSSGSGGSALTSCDQNISAGSGASCQLAENTFYEFSQSGQQSGESLHVYDPDSQQTFALTCDTSSVVDCYGPDGSLLAEFSAASVAAYTQAQAQAYANAANLGDSTPY